MQQKIIYIFFFREKKIVAYFATITITTKTYKKNISGKDAICFKKTGLFYVIFFSFINVKLIFKKTSSSSQQQLNVEFYWTSLKSFETAAIYCFLFLSTFFRTTWRHTGDIPRHLNSKKIQKFFDISSWNKLIEHWSCQNGLFPAF